MDKRKQKKKLFKRPICGILTVMMVLPWLLLPASANSEVYEHPYSPHAAIAYAEQYAYNSNPEYGKIYVADNNGYAVEEDCTFFLSQCLFAGGLPESDGWNRNNTSLWIEPHKTRDGLLCWIRKGYLNEGFKTFVNAGRLNQYLANQGYYVEKNVNISGNALSISVLHPSAGDILQYDWDGDGTIDHSVLYCGIVDGEPRYTAHTNAAYREPISTLEKVTRPPSYSDGRIYGTVTYLIHMTDTTGLTDVTSRYIGRRIALKSIEVNQYVSSDTDQNVSTVDAVANRNTASTWEWLDVVANQYGEVGFKSCGNGNYLSAIIDENSASAPIRAAYGKDYSAPQAWESFRIFEKDGVQYIQSQANGKWVQVVANQNTHPVRAAAREASTWERFAIEIVA